MTQVQLDVLYVLGFGIPLALIISIILSILTEGE